MVSGITKVRAHQGLDRAILEGWEHAWALNDGADRLAARACPKPSEDAAKEASRRASTRRTISQIAAHLAESDVYATTWKARQVRLGNKLAFN